MDLSKQELAYLIDQNLFESLVLQGKNFGVELNKDMIKLNTHVTHPYFNVSFVLRNYKDHINDALSYFKDVSYRFVLGDENDFETAKEDLISKGLFFAEDTISMALELKQLEPCSLDGLIEVEDDEDLKKWLNPIMVSYRVNDTLTDFIFNYYKEIGFKDLFKHYILQIEGKSVGACSLFTKDHVVGLYNVCILPEFRNKGYGTLLTKKVLNLSKQWGYPLAILQASKEGCPLYEKIGFERINKQCVFIYLKK